MMKQFLPYLLAIVVGLATYFFQQTRIDDLETKVQSLQTDSTTPGESSPSHSLSQKSAERINQTSTPTPKSGERIITPQDEQKDTLRSFSDAMNNDAGRAMMKQGIAMAIPQLYGAFIESLELTDEEKKHFNGLLTDKLITRQQLGMQWMQTSEEKKKELGKQIAEAEKANQEAIETFLNDEKDTERFKRYERELPERQALSGIRDAIAKTDTPLTPEKEEELVASIYQARLNSGSDSGDDSAIWASISQHGGTSEIKKRWDTADAYLETSLPDILTETQQEAFLTYWKQLREIQLMQYEMANRMMNRGASQETE